MEGVSFHYKKKWQENNLGEAFKLILVHSFETDWANVQTEFLVSAANIQRCNVKDGQARWLICSVFNDRFAPLIVLSLQEKIHYHCYCIIHSIENCFTWMDNFWKNFIFILLPLFADQIPISNYLVLWYRENTLIFWSHMCDVLHKLRSHWC